MGSMGRKGEVRSEKEDLGKKSEDQVGGEI